MPDQKDPIKEAFTKVKQDTTELKKQLLELSHQLQDLKQTLNTQPQQTNKQTNTFHDEFPQTLHKTTQIPTHPEENQTNQHINPTQKSIPTHKMPLYSPKTQNTYISTGNDGVPTNKPTNKPTNQHIGNKGDFPLQPLPLSQVLESLDTIKKEVRLKFKRLSQGEMAVFSLIYELEEQGFIVDYPLLAAKLNLSEISIRDYIHKLIKKGIPLKKTKENNKKVTLSVLPELKKIASLQTIQTLREL